MKRKDKTNIISIIVRYLIVLLIGLNLAFFSKILTNITLFFSSSLLGIFYDLIVVGKNILIGDFSIEIVEACVATSAYYLLFILNLVTPMSLKKRAYYLLFSLPLLFILNIMRIFLFTLLVLNFKKIFYYTHFLTWLFLSSIFVFLIWLIAIHLFKIKSLPVYTDLIFLKKLTKS